MRPDWELLSSWRDGDKRAGAELLRRYFGLLSRIFYNKVATPEDAADLVSETLLACIKNKDRVRDGSNFRSYLTSVALNQLRLYYRKRSKRKRERDDFLSLCVADLEQGPSPSSQLARRREERLMVQGLRRIPIEYQFILELSLFEGLNGREIAEMLGIPTATAYTRLRRAKEHLGNAVEKLANNPVEFTSTMTSLAGWAANLRDKMKASPGGG